MTKDFRKEKPRKSELRCHISPSTHNAIRAEAQEMGIGAFIEALMKIYEGQKRNTAILEKIAEKMKFVRLDRINFQEMTIL